MPATVVWRFREIRSRRGACGKLSRSLCAHSIDRSDCSVHGSCTPSWVSSCRTLRPVTAARGGTKSWSRPAILWVIAAPGHRRPHCGAQKGRTVSRLREEGVTKQNDRETCASIAPIPGKPVALGWSSVRGFPAERFPKLTRLHYGLRMRS